MMAWHRIGTKPLSEPMLADCQLDIWEPNKIFVQENSFENVVCKMVAILSEPHHVTHSQVYDLETILLHSYALKIFQGAHFTNKD